MIDSDRTIDYLSGRRDDVRFLDALQGPLYISLITVGEAYEGVYGATDPTRHEAGFEALMRKAPILPLTLEVMRVFAQVRNDLRRVGARIADMDLLIAATALHHNLTLVTRNLRDFGRVPGLPIL